MSSPCTRLVRCRVKDLASCFYACKFPLDEESSDTVCSTLPQMKNASMATNLKCSSKTRDSGGKISVANNICNEEEEEEGESSAQSSTLNSTDNNGVEEGSRDPKWPRFSEEDYIVFCFREDGAIHMINESKPSKTFDGTNKKMFHHQDRVGRSSDAVRVGDFDEHREDVQTDAEEIPILVGEEEWSNEMERDWREDEIKEIDSATIGAKACGEESFESCNSIRSDTSTNSFSFPKLGIEWIGSPVHMPKSEKHKAASVLLHCCRF